MYVSRVEILVRDLARSQDFYGGLLGLADERVRVVEGVADDGWVDDDRQLGNRHLAFYVSDVDAEAARLAQAGVEFLFEPVDHKGGVRLAYFRDPDGTVLELLSGTPTYDRTRSPALATQERMALPGPGEPPRLAHLAVTVQRPPADGVIGEMDIEEKGMLLTFVAGPAPLELASFARGELLPEANGNLRAVGT